MEQTFPKPGRLALHLLGELEVLVDGAAQRLPPSKKARALLGYLVATRRACARSQLCDLLWEGPGDPRAALRWSLTHLRAVIEADGATRLCTEHDKLGFVAAGAYVDLDALAQQVARASLSTAELEAALGLFRGDFLEGLELEECPRFHAWLIAERESLRGQRFRWLDQLIERLSDEPARALAWARKRVQLDPLDEASHVRVLSLLAALGREREAYAHYESARRTLTGALGKRPFVALEVARAELAAREQTLAPVYSASAEQDDQHGQHGQARSESERASDAPASSLTRSHAAAPRGERGTQPFVGRAALRERARGWLDAAWQRRATPLLVEGEPGMGKSRFLAELARDAEQRGGRALYGRAFEVERVRPYGSFIDALRSAPRAALPSARSELGLLVPEWSREAPAVDIDRNRLFEAAAETLRALCPASGPLLVVLDDVQWIDAASLALLHYCLRALASEPIAFACALRPGELIDNPAALAFVRELEREFGPLRLALEPLSDDEIATIVRARCLHDADAVVRASEGNPFFALELCREQAGSTSGSLSALLDARLERVPERARHLLSWAAALGRSFPLPLLGSAMELSASELLLQVDCLEQRGLIRALGSEQTERFDFTHDLLRAAAYRRLSGPSRRLVHRRLALTLSQFDDGSDALAGEALRHAMLAGDAALAAPLSVRAAERCLRLCASAEAAQMAERGLSQLAGLDGAQYLALAARLLHVLTMLGELEADPKLLQQRIERVLHEAQKRGLDDVVRQGMRSLMALHFRTGDTRAAARASVGAVRMGAASAPDARTLAFSARCLVFIERDLSKARALTARALEAPSGDAADELSFLRGVWAHWEGELELGRALLEQTLPALVDQGDSFRQSECLERLAAVALEQGDLEACRRFASGLATASLRYGENSGRQVAQVFLALAELDGGSEQAEAALARALEGLCAIDNKARVAHALATAAELCLKLGRAPRAREHAEAALGFARAAELTSELVRASALLGRIAEQAGASEQADARAREACAAAASAEELPARAKAALAWARGRVGSTPAPTPTPTAPTQTRRGQGGQSWP